MCPPRLSRGGVRFCRPSRDVFENARATQRAQATGAKAKAALESIVATAAATALQEKEILQKELKNAKEDRNNFESASAQMQASVDRIKREKDQLQAYLEQQESEVRGDRGPGGGVGAQTRVQLLLTIRLIKY